MEETWASGAIELLKHADSHIQKETAFDARIAFISIDNSVEVSIRTFLSLPEKNQELGFPKEKSMMQEIASPKWSIYCLVRQKQIDRYR